MVSVLALSLAAAAQEEVRSEVSIVGTGFFTANRSAEAEQPLSYSSTDTGGVQASYRFNINRWAGVDLNYGWGRNSQIFSSLGNAFSRARFEVHQTTLDFVAKFPMAGRFRPYVLAGTGALIFHPVERQVASFTTVPGGAPVERIPTRAQAVFLYGTGVDIYLRERAVGERGIAFRVGYRGFVHGVPNFGFNALDLQRTTHTAQPEAGLVFLF